MHWPAGLSTFFLGLSVDWGRCEVLRVLLKLGEVTPDVALLDDSEVVWHVVLLDDSEAWHVALSGDSEVAQAGLSVVRLADVAVGPPSEHGESLGAVAAMQAP